MITDSEGNHANWIKFLEGRLAQEREDFQEALVAFESVLEAEPDHAYARITMGCVLARLGRIDEAVTVFDDTVSMFKDDPDVLRRYRAAVALSNKALHLANGGRSEEAIAVYGDIVKRYGNDLALKLRYRAAVALMDQSVVFSNLSRDEEATSSKDQILKLFGDDPEIPLREFFSDSLIEQYVSEGKIGIDKAYWELTQSDLDTTTGWTRGLETLLEQVR